MIISGSELRKELKEAFPGCFVPPIDRAYYCPTRYELWDGLISSYMEDYQFTAEIMDCDDFALVLKAWFTQEQYKHKWAQPWAFGVSTGINATGGHAINVARTSDDGIVLVEPQNDKVWTPDGVYRPYFVWM
jgi:hypothetical protein